MFEQRKPRVAVHWAGSPTSGGPAKIAAKLLQSDLAEDFDLFPLHQTAAAGPFNLQLVASWIRALREQDVDLVHVSGLGNEGFHAALASWVAGRRTLVVVHGTVRDLRMPGSRLRNSIVAHLLEPLTLLMADRVGTVSKHASTRRFLAPFKRKLSTPLLNGTEVLRNPGDPPVDRGDLGISPDAVVAISVGRMSLEKGFGTLAEAMAAAQRELRDCGFHLVLVGTGPDEPAIRHLYDGVADMVTFTGAREDVPALLRMSDMFCLPSFHENLSVAILEAMSAGVCIIASDIPGNREAIGNAGSVVPVGDPHALGRSLVEHTRSALMRSEMGQRAKERHLNLFTSEAMVDRYRTTYRETMRLDAK